RDHFGFRDHVAIDVEDRNATDRKPFAEFWHPPVFRELDRNARKALGVDLHADAGGIGAEISGIEFHHDLALLCAAVGAPRPARGLRNFRMNWSVCPRIVGSNTRAVRGSAGLARIELSESNLNPAASTSRRTVEASIRCRVSVTSGAAPAAAEW